MSDSQPVYPNRFYKEATVADLDGTFAIHLDGKPVRTPMGNSFVLPVQALGEAIAGEWMAQGESIDPSSMPLCGYANTAIDRIANERETVFDTLLKFADTDLLCYRADHPDDLVKRQIQNWQPILDWAAQSLGVHLNVTVGVLPIEQPEQALHILREKLGDLNDMELTAVASLAAACGSLILALALAGNRIDAKKAFHLSLLDEIFQSERWGLDSEAQARQAKLREDIASAALFLSLLKQ